MIDMTLERRVQRLADIQGVAVHAMTPALQPELAKPYDSFCESTSYPDKPARVERVVNNESEDQ